MPVDIAWKCAIKACLEFKADYPDYKLDILFAVRREEIKKVGIAELKRQVQGCGYCGDRGDTGDR
ncbi:MAG: hypothetical protein Q4E57_06580 [Eubacteriales bacterium]|nr:hypothetical protein [Eubacteriales bacterium]